jgi:hypothetical protein
MVDVLSNTYYVNNKGSYSEFCEEIQDYLPKCHKILVNGVVVTDISGLSNLQNDATISLFMNDWLIHIYYSHWQQMITVDYVSV